MSMKMVAAELVAVAKELTAQDHIVKSSMVRAHIHGKDGEYWVEIWRDGKQLAKTKPESGAEGLAEAKRVYDELLKNLDKILKAYDESYNG